MVMPSDKCPRCVSLEAHDVLPACELSDSRSRGWMSYEEMTQELRRLGCSTTVGAHVARGCIDKCCDDRKHLLDWQHHPTLYRIVSEEMVLACDVRWRLSPPPSFRGGGFL